MSARDDACHAAPRSPPDVDINTHWLVKLEGHYMSGTASLRNPVSINPPDITTADPRWGAFFLKTTAYF